MSTGPGSGVRARAAGLAHRLNRFTADLAHHRLGDDVAERLQRLAPAGISTALVLTALGGAGALTVRSDQHGGLKPAARLSSVQAVAAQAQLAVPPAPEGAQPAPGIELDPAPSVGTVAHVARPGRLVEATALVTSSRPLPAARLRAIRHVYGVQATQTMRSGFARVDGRHAFVLGVRPAAFRPWTPRLTARSQPLWQSIARGELTASFDMGHNAQLPLGGVVPVSARQRLGVRVGAFASVGMSGVDAVVSDLRAAQLGLAPDTAVVVSAPHANALDLRAALHAAGGPSVHVALLRVVIVVRDAGEFMTRTQINTVLQTAAHQVGKPYVWGAAGPSSFDCSGLVQYAFASAGIRMPRVSQQQWFAGPHISYASARPGDLLFWHYDPTDRGDIDHVAIYAGNGMMLVAPHTGAYVEYVPVPFNQMAGVVRVDPALAAQIG